MNCFNISYKQKVATEQEIREHLFICSDNFNPHLSSYVDINQYSCKIFSNAITFEAWDSENLIGLIAAYFNNKEKKIGWITNVSVMKEYAGLGIANKLLKSVVAYGIAKKYNSLELEVYVDNTAAINLYIKNGFLESKMRSQRDNVKVFKLIL